MFRPTVRRRATLLPLAILALFATSFARSQDQEPAGSALSATRRSSTAEARRDS